MTTGAIVDLSTKARMFVARVKSGSVKRMYSLARDIHDETGRSTPLTFLDMGWCILRYGIGYQEYRGYHFEGKPAAQRATFMTMNHNTALIRELNDPEDSRIFEDKTEFLRLFRNYVKRDWCDLHEVDVAGFERFLEAHSVVFAKPSGSFGGQGIERIESASVADAAELHARLAGGGVCLIEEAITQHPAMATLSPNAIATLRMCTVLVDGEPRHIYTIVRMGVGDSAVDNATSGGIYTWVDPDGTLRYPAFSDKTGFTYTEHPTTGLAFDGYRIPYYAEAMEFVKQAALVMPSVGYVGWDVAITSDGPIMVEGNTIPGYDMPQNSAWNPDGNGVLPLFEHVLGREIGS